MRFYKLLQETDAGDVVDPEFQGSKRDDLEEKAKKKCKESDDSDCNDYDDCNEEDEDCNDDEKVEENDKSEAGKKVKKAIKLKKTDEDEDEKEKKLKESTFKNYFFAECHPGTEDEDDDTLEQELGDFITKEDLIDLIKTLDNETCDIVATAVFDTLDMLTAELTNNEIKSIDDASYDEFDDHEDFELEDDITESDDEDEESLNEIDVKVDRGHVRQLKRIKRTAAWKKEALKRRKFKKTAAGKLLKRKMRIYQKKYKAAHKAQLKNYQKSYAKFKASQN